MKKLSLLRVARRGLAYHWRMHSGVFLGILLSTAIVTGALILGDSARYTLRSIALSRLAGASYASYNPNRYLAEGLAERLTREERSNPSAVLLLQAMALPAGGASASQNRVNRVQVLGVDEHFWKLTALEPPQWKPQEALINERLARTLALSEGDSLALRVVTPSLMALDAPLSPGSDETATRVQLKVKGIVSDEEGGRFNLSNEQRSPFNIFVPLHWLQDLVDLEDKCNLLLAGEDWDEASLQQQMEEQWRLEDLGLSLRSVADRGFQLESDRIFLDDTVVSAALSLPHSRGRIAYLVNSISTEAHSTPYAFAVVGETQSDLKDDEALVNEWLAEKLHLKTGDAITVRWYVVTPVNEFVEQSRDFRVKAIRPMAELDEEREAMPVFPGLSDVESCTDWDVGMPMDEEALKDKDNEAYWDTWRQTPKLWVTLSAGLDMWGSRFGAYTSVSFSPSHAEVESLEAQLREGIAPELLGLRFMPVREEALHSVAEALDLGHLFLGMSFFLIVSALLLSVLLFKFSLEQRASEMGALLTLGFTRKHVLYLFALEALVLAVAGGGVGILAGTGYARLLLLGLGRAWAGAVAGTEIVFYLKPMTLFIGLLAGTGLPLLAVFWMLWRQGRLQAIELLHRDFSQQSALPVAAGKNRGKGWLLALLGLFVGLAVMGTVFLLEPPSMAPWFFITGAWLLTVGIYAWRHFLKHYGFSEKTASFSLNQLALLQLTRRPGRNAAAVALLASGIFLALSVISMQEDLQKHAAERWSGTGGYALFGESTAALSEAPAYEGIAALPLRYRQGDDAGCLNLNRAASPHIYGVDPELLKATGAFDQNRGEENIWNLLQQPQADGAVPALVGDRDTVIWGLNARAHPVKGDTLIYGDEAGGEVMLRLVGALPMRLSVFQGSLLLSLDDFTRIFPSESGFKAFLFDLDGVEAEEAIHLLQQKEGKAGMQVETALQRLEAFYTVERAYLHMFLLLGALGVTLGALGLGVITARSRIERRGEWAMLQALGFKQADLLRLLAVELVMILLVAGFLGGGASFIALLPSLLLSSTLPPLSHQLLGFFVMLGSAALSSLTALVLTRSQSILADLRRE